MDNVAMSTVQAVQTGMVVVITLGRPVLKGDMGAMTVVTTTTAQAMQANMAMGAAT